MKKKVLTALCAAMVAASGFVAETGTASAAHKHSYSCTVIRPVLCDVNGINRYTCSCGEAYEKQVPMPGHKYSETVLKDPSCISKGIVRKTCTVCGSTFTGSIPKAAHQYVTSGSITKCRTCGKEVSSGSASESRTPETKPAQPAKPVTPAKPADTRNSSEKARQAAVDWAIKIAGDNSFHYGRSSWAHHNGCYFCGTNQKAGSLKRKAGASKAACEKTYCCNPFVTAAYKHGAGAKEDGTVAFHAYQSFAPGEATPELAHEIGVALAKELWGDRFQVLIATHLNTGCLHNHMVINSFLSKTASAFTQQRQATAS